MINGKNTVFIIAVGRNYNCLIKLLSTLLYTMYPKEPNIIVYNDTLKPINIQYDKLLILNNNCEISDKKIGCGGARYYLLEKAKELNYDYIFSIDDDIEFDNEWWVNIKNGINNNLGYDLYTCVIYDGVNKKLYNYGQDIIIDNYEFKRIQIINKNGEYNQCTTGCGTAKFFTKELANKIHFCKDAYIGEDSILDFELIKLNTKCLCINNAKIFHRANRYLCDKIKDFRTTEHYLNYIYLFSNNCNLFQKDVVLKVFPNLKNENNKDIMINIYKNYLSLIKKQKTGINKNNAIKALKEFYDVCLKNNITPFLTCGTLLGYVRENDFIKYDLDIDVGILYNQFNIDLIKKLQENGFIFYHSFGMIKDSFEFSVIKYNIKIDIFIFYQKDDGYYNTVFDAINNNWEQDRHMMYMYYYPKDIFNGDLIEEKFNNRLNVFVPKNYIDFIIYHYGEDYNIPKQSWDYRKDPKCSIQIGVKQKERVSV